MTRRSGPGDEAAPSAVMPTAPSVPRSADDRNPLTASECRERDACEAIVAAGLHTFVEVGTELAKIRDHRLYRNTHGDFASYLRDRWGISRAEGYRRIAAAAVAMSPIGDKVSNEAQARELVPLLDDPERMAEVVEQAEASGKITAASLAAAREVTPSIERPSGQRTTLHLLDGKTMDVALPKASPKFNPTNDSISWAAWSWNPITGCLHGCDYCYAREISTSGPASSAFPAGFEPAFRPERLDAPASTTFPADDPDPRRRRVFVGSMADLFGEWVPQEWIDAVFASANRTPEWDYLFLTKFPQRYKRLSFPPGAWAGTSVDRQKRVRIAERSMSALRDNADVAVRWLSIEPLLEPLTFADLSWCDLMVIGAQTTTRQPGGTVPAFAPPFRWVFDLVRQADDAGVPVYLKPNLCTGPGMVLPQELPRGFTETDVIA